MKKWTVMVMPHQGGSTYTIGTYPAFLWAVAGVLITLPLLLGFLFERYQAAGREIDRLEQTNRELRTVSAGALSPGQVPAGQQDTMEQAIRKEYEARYKAVGDRLGELYELEGQVRAIHGLPPRPSAYVSLDNSPNQGRGGKGGPLSDQAEEPVAGLDALARPLSIIYGLSEPSVDSIVQEINLRTASLTALLEDMEQKRDRIARTPSIWPSSAADRWISSSFGHRKDPFTRRVRHHSGTDIVAPYGSPVLATGRGTVVTSGYDSYLGNYLKIDHGDGVMTLYGHLQKRLVKTGDKVERGDTIGKVGDTGRSTGAHIHYEVHINDKAVNSAKYLGN